MPHVLTPELQERDEWVAAERCDGQTEKAAGFC